MFKNIFMAKPELLTDPADIAQAMDYFQSKESVLNPGTGGGAEIDLAAGGGGAWNQNVDFASGATGAVANRTVGSYYVPGYVRPTGDGVEYNILNWDKFLVFDCVLEWIESSATSVAYLKLSEDTTHAALGSKGIAISGANLVVSGHHYDTQIRTTAGIYTATADIPFHVTFVHIPGIGEYIYIDGVQKYAVTTNLISGNGAAASAYLVSRANGITAAQTQVRIARPRFWFPLWL